MFSPFCIDQFTISLSQDLHFLCVQQVQQSGSSPPCFRNASRSCKKPKNGAKPVPAERSNMRRVTLLRYLQQSDRMTVKASESMSTMITQAFSKAFHLKRPWNLDSKKGWLPTCYDLLRNCDSFRSEWPKLNNLPKPPGTFRLGFLFTTSCLAALENTLLAIMWCLSLSLSIG